MSTKFLDYTGLAYFWGKIKAKYMWRGSYERIQGTSSEHKDLNNYKTAGFYNIKTQYVDNCPSGIDIDAVLLVYPWNSGSYCTQEITESAASGSVRRWLRRFNSSSWSAWKQVAFTDGDISGNAATATKLATPVTINGISFDGSANITVTDSTKVSKSGDTMTGNLAIKKNGPVFSLINNRVEINTTTAQFDTRINFYDKNEHSLGSLITRIYSDKSSYTYLRSFSFVSTNYGNVFADISVGFDKDGKVKTAAPNPSASSNTNEIATTKWVNDKGYVLKSGDTMTGALNGRASNVNLSVEPSSANEDWKFNITRNSADTTHTGNLMRLGIVQSIGTKDYRLILAVANPRAGNLPTQESIAGGEDDSDARISNCWGGIGIYYDYSKNRAYPYCYDLDTCDLSDNSTQRLATNRWVRTATGDFACNAASASTVPWSGVTGKPSELDALSGISSNIQAQLDGKIEEPDLWNWQKTEKAGAVAFKPVPESDLEPVVDFLFTEISPAEGDKGPDNPSMISGTSSVKATRCGKNLIPLPSAGSTTVNGVTFTVNADGSVHARGTASATTYFYLASDVYIPSGTYVLSGCPSGGGSDKFAVRITDSDRSYALSDYGTTRNVELATSQNSIFSIRVQSGYTLDTTFYPQLELGTAATDFEPYEEGNDYTIQLGDTYYGGYLDVATGVMTVTWDAYQFTGTEQWALDATNSTSSMNYFRCAPSIPHMMSDMSVQTRACSHFVFSGYTSVVPSFATWAQVPRIILRLPSATYPDVAALNTWLASEYEAGHPVTVVYALDQPYTVQLTPTQIRSLPALNKYEPRINTVYTDQEAVRVGYQRFFDEKRLAALEARIEALENTNA